MKQLLKQRVFFFFFPHKRKCFSLPCIYILTLNNNLDIYIRHTILFFLFESYWYIQIQSCCSLHLVMLIGSQKNDFPQRLLFLPVALEDCQNSFKLLPFSIISKYISLVYRCLQGRLYDISVCAIVHRLIHPSSILIFAMYFNETKLFKYSSVYLPVWKGKENIL